VLFPGDILGSGIIEKMLWHSRISPLTTDVAVVVAVVAVNALIWLVVALIIGAVRRGVRSAKVE
jgi:predicted cobalt transporter CbtA